MNSLVTYCKGAGDVLSAEISQMQSAVMLCWKMRSKE